MVGVLGLGGAFEGGEVAAFVADFVAGGFAGSGAGAVFARDVDTCGRLGPVFGLFHGTILPRGRCKVRRVFTPWPVSGARGNLSP